MRSQVSATRDRWSALRYSVENAASVQAMLANYEQMPLLGTVLEILMEDKAEAPELVADAVGQSLLHVKAVVDCLHRRSHANSR